VITCNAIFLDEELNPMILSGSTHEIQDQPDMNVIEYIGPKNQKGQDTCNNQSTDNQNIGNSSILSSMSGSSSITEVNEESNLPPCSHETPVVSAQPLRPNKAIAFEIPKELFIRNRPPEITESRLRTRSNTFTRSSNSESDNERLERQFSSLRDEKYGLLDRIMELEREIRDLASKLEELAESKAEIASKNHAKSKLISDAREEIAKIKSELSSWGKFNLPHDDVQDLFKELDKLI